MRVLWLAPVHYRPDEDVHPAPWIHALAAQLNQDPDFKLTILNYEPRLPQAELVKQQEGIDYVFLKTPLPKKDHLGFFRKRIAIIREWIEGHRHEFDLIHVHGSEHQYEASIIDTGIPFVLSMQGVMNACLPHLDRRWTYTHLNWWMSAWYERRTLKSVRHFICRTHFDSGYALSRNPEAQVHENWEMIRPEFFTSLGDASSDQVLYMGGTHPIKGVDLLMRAMDIVRKEIPLRIKMLGTTDKEYLSNVIKEHQLKNIRLDDIEMLGFQDVDGVVEAMRSSFCMVHSSRIDNSPNSVCEAQVGGLPVIANDVGGVSSLIRHEHTGLLSQPDPLDIAQKILQLYRNPSLYSTLKSRSSEMATERHDPQVIAQRTLEIYSTVMLQS